MLSGFSVGFACVDFHFLIFSHFFPFSNIFCRRPKKNSQLQSPPRTRLLNLRLATMAVITDPIEDYYELGELLGEYERPLFNCYFYFDSPLARR